MFKCYYNKRHVLLNRMHAFAYTNNLPCIYISEVCLSQTNIRVEIINARVAIKKWVPAALSSGVKQMSSSYMLF
jgi:hypothetical protein